jgi:transcriptional regulator with GAF, ATPase, and Fis domain
MSSLLMPLLQVVAAQAARVAAIDAENAYLREEIRRLEAEHEQAVHRLEVRRSGGQRNADRGVLTRDELRRVERENLTRALERCRWRVFGPRGAAALLGMKPTTLASRIKALGMTRPARRLPTPGIPEF